MQPSRDIKCVVVGDEICRKNVFLTTFVQGQYPHRYEPTSFDNECIDRTVDGKLVMLNLWDTSSQEEFDRLRTLAYPNTKIFLCVFNIDNPDSLVHIFSKWNPEVRYYCPGVPVILVGLGAELPNNPAMGLIAREEAEIVALKIGAMKYMECSVRFNMGVSEIFDEAVRVVFSKEMQEHPGPIDWIKNKMSPSFQQQIANDFLNSPAVRNRIRCGKLSKGRAEQEAEKIKLLNWACLSEKFAHRLQQLIREGFTLDQALGLDKTFRERGEPVDYTRILASDTQEKIFSMLDSLSAQTLSHVSRCCREVGTTFFARQTMVPNNGQTGQLTLKDEVQQQHLHNR